MWLVLAAVLFIVEIFAGTAALLCLCAGCILAMLAALLGFSFPVQAVVMSVATIAIFFMLGPAIRRFYSRFHGVRHHISNMDALIGREGRVTSTVTDNYTDGGRVQIDGDSWQAFTTSVEQPIHVGSTVRVESYDSIVLHVRPAGEMPPVIE